MASWRAVLCNAGPIFVPFSLKNEFVAEDEIEPRGDHHADGDVYDVKHPQFIKNRKEYDFYDDPRQIREIEGKVLAPQAFPLLFGRVIPGPYPAERKYENDAYFNNQ